MLDYKLDRSTDHCDTADVQDIVERPGPAPVMLCHRRQPPSAANSYCECLASKRCINLHAYGRSSHVKKRTRLVSRLQSCAGLHVFYQQPSHLINKASGTALRIQTDRVIRHEMSSMSCQKSPAYWEIVLSPIASLSSCRHVSCFNSCWGTSDRKALPTASHIAYTQGIIGSLDMTDMISK